jgi:UDP-glucose 4-epimerase
MKILVTGGAGFIGTNLIKRLVAEGHDVISYDNYSTGSLDNHQPGARYQGGILDNSLPILVSEQEFDLCYHLAALARIQPSFVYTTAYFNSNVAFTQEILQLSVEHDFKVIYAGSSSKYGGVHSSPYANFKWLGEQLCEMYHNMLGVDVLIARFYNVYGPHEITTGEQAALIGKWRHLVETNEMVPIVGDGRQSRDFTHVDDIVDGLVRMADYKGDCMDFDLGRGQSYMINEVFDMFKQRFDHIKSYYIDDQPGNYSFCKADYHKAQYELRWTPTRNLPDYIASL